MNWLQALCNQAQLISTVTSEFSLWVFYHFPSYIFLILSPLLSFVLSCDLSFYLMDILFHLPLTPFSITYLKIKLTPGVLQNITPPQLPQLQLSSICVFFSLHSLYIIAISTYFHIPFFSFCYNHSAHLFRPISSLCCTTDIVAVPSLDTNP